MKQVRKGFFETNSSSSHALSLCVNHQEYTPDVLHAGEDGIYHTPCEYIDDGEYNSTDIKIMVCAQFILGLEYHPEYERVKELFCRVLMAHTNATDVRLELCNYIDANVVYEHPLWQLFVSYEHLEAFIFNQESLFWLEEEQSEEESHY